MMSSAYQAVNEATLPEILGQLPAIAEILGGPPAGWRVREVGDGNLNLVFIVMGPRAGVVAKQALPYVRLVGESWPLPLERSWFEYSALTEQARHAPGRTPQVHYFDRTQAMIVMEYLAPHIIMRKGLIQGVEYPRFADDISAFMAATLFHTSVLAGPAKAHKQRVQLFAANTELCRITEDLVFTDPYREAPLNRWNTPFLDADKRAFEQDTALKLAAQARKYQFLTCAQALIHGDLHTGSIMLTADDTRVIDPEFAFAGPIGFDVGAVIGNLLLAHCAQAGHELKAGARDSCRHWILAQIAAVWTGFHDKFLGFWEAAHAGDAYQASLFPPPDAAKALADARRRLMRILFEDTLAFAGLEMIRRILGLAHVEDLESIPDPALRAACERKALYLARGIILGAGSFSSIDDVVTAARQ